MKTNQFYWSSTVVATVFAIAICGLYLVVDTRQKLYNGETCEMTYSGVRYLQIPWIVKKEENQEESINSVDGTSARTRQHQYVCSMADPGVAISQFNGNHRTRGSKTSNNESRITSRYRLMQFHDFRDDRFKGFNKATQENYPDGLCQNDVDILDPMWNPGHPVLFVPGHWGSYEQARSLGAHGIRMTEQRKVPAALRQRLHHLRYGNHSQVLYGNVGQLNGDGFENDRDSFVFDVYTLDFKEESSALHGFMLWEQSEIIQHAIRSIVHRIEMSLQLQQQLTSVDKQIDSGGLDPIIQVTIVGHSIGGVVAAGAFIPPFKTGTHSSKQITKDQAYLSQHVSSLVTLATPHTFPIAPDPSVRQFYNAVNKYWKLQSEANINTTNDSVAEKNDDASSASPLPTIVSISGGFRDELIHPSWCNLDAILPQKSGISLMASESSSSFSTPAHYASVGGMDHVAIVWCHNVMSSVRNLIHASYTRRHSRQESSTETSSKRRDLQYKRIIHAMTDDARSHQLEDGEINQESCSYRHEVEVASRALHKSMSWFRRMPFHASTSSQGPRIFAILCAVVFVPQILSLCGGFTCISREGLEVQKNANVANRGDRSSIIVLSARHFYATGAVVLPAAILASWSGGRSVADGLAVAFVSLIWVWCVYSCLIWILFPFLQWLSKKICRLLRSLRRKKEATISKSPDSKTSLSATPRNDLMLQNLAIAGVLSLSGCVSYGWWRGANWTLFRAVIVMKAVAFIWFYVFFAACTMTAVARFDDARSWSLNKHYVAATILLVLPVHLLGAVLYAFSIISGGGSGVYSSVDRGDELLACMAMHIPLLIQLVDTNIERKTNSVDTNESFKDTGVATKNTCLVLSQVICFVLLLGGSVYAFQFDQSMHTTRVAFDLISTILFMAHLLKQNIERTRDKHKES